MPSYEHAIASPEIRIRYEQAQSCYDGNFFFAHGVKSLHATGNALPMEKIAPGGPQSAPTLKRCLVRLRLQLSQEASQGVKVRRFCPYDGSGLKIRDFWG